MKIRSMLSVTALALSLRKLQTKSCSASNETAPSETKGNCMRNLLIIPLTTCLLALGLSPAFRGECYDLTATITNPPVPSMSSYPVRNGEPLTSDQQAGIDAAIAVLVSVEHCLDPVDGYSGPMPPPDGDTIPGFLGDLNDNGNICQDIFADWSKTQSSASNPVTGNGPNSDGSVTYSTTGHPGINFASSNIPKPTPGGTYQHNGQSFDGSHIGSTAGALIHESSHLTNPNNTAASAGEYENTAREFATMQMCKAVDCKDDQGDFVLSDEVKKGLCYQILAENKAADASGGTPVNCEPCERVGIDVLDFSRVAGPGGPGNPTGSGPSIGNGQLTFSVVQESPYVGDAYIGTIELLASTINGKLRLKLRSDNGDYYTTIKLSSYGIFGFSPTSFVQLDNFGLIMSGWYSNGASSALVRIDFDLASRTVGGATLLLESPGETPAVDMSIGNINGVNRIFMLASASKDVDVYLIDSNLIVNIASSLAIPSLLQKSAITHYAVPSGGYVIVAHDGPSYAMNNPLLDLFKTQIYDFDDDNILDHVISSN